MRLASVMGALLAAFCAAAVLGVARISAIAGISHVSCRFIDNFLRARELSTASLTDFKKLFCAAGNFVRDSHTSQTMRILPRITGRRGTDTGASWHHSPFLRSHATR